jgi:hypothetical protein
LPPSYRAFLKCSNGWRNTGFFIDRLWSTDDLEWFRVRHQEWISDWNLGEAHDATTNPGQPTGGGSYEGAALPFTLEISDVGDSAIYLLNPRAERSEVLQQLEPRRGAIPFVPADDRERAQAVPVRSGS